MTKFEGVAQDRRTGARRRISYTRVAPALQVSNPAPLTNLEAVVKRLLRG